MNNKITNLFKTTKEYLVKHSPEILTGIGVTGMITSTVLAVKATPKAIKLIDDARMDKSRNNVDLYGGDYSEELTTLEIVKAGWKPYIPAAITGVISMTCIIGASATNSKRNAALATAYKISEKTLTKYQDKVIETIGEKKEKEIRDKVSQDNIDNNPMSKTQVVISSKGNTLFMDSISGRYFKSDIDKIKKVVNELNRQMVYENYISLEEFYYEIGLDPIKNSSRLGWNLQEGLIEINYSTCLADNDEPCIVLDYQIAPRYEFDKLM